MKLSFDMIQQYAGIAVIGIGVIIFIVSLLKIRFGDSRHKKNYRFAKRSGKLGYLGFLGLAGFSGIATYVYNGSVLPFCLLVFLGFFGYFFDGKMSNTLSNEKLYKNRKEAERNALKVGFRMQLMLMVGVAMIYTKEWLNITVVICISGTALIAAIVIFMTEYMVYKYDCADVQNWEDEKEVL